MYSPHPPLFFLSLFSSCSWRFIMKIHDFPCCVYFAIYVSTSLTTKFQTSFIHKDSLSWLVQEVFKQYICLQIFLIYIYLIQVLTLTFQEISRHVWKCTLLTQPNVNFHFYQTTFEIPFICFISPPPSFSSHLLIIFFK